MKFQKCVEPRYKHFERSNLMFTVNKYERTVQYCAYANSCVVYISFVNDSDDFRIEVDSSNAFEGREFYIDSSEQEISYKEFFKMIDEQLPSFKTALVELL